MSEEETKSSSSSVGVPIAIVLAGGLVALAIYFGGGIETNKVNDKVVQDVNAPTQEEAVTISYDDISPVSSDDHVRGNANTKVTIIEYSDPECPFCKKFHPDAQRLVSEYPDDVKWVYRHLPLAMHAKSKKEVIATECAGDQGKFWELLDKIYETTPSNDGLDLEKLPQLAQQVGVSDIATFKSCLTSNKHDEKIASDMADAQAAGAKGTPYSVIIGPNKEVIPVNGAQPYEFLKTTVDSLLQ